MGEFIYVLRLTGNRFYIGKTTNMEQRFEQHLSGTAAAWTKKYKPISIERIIYDIHPYDEDKFTKQYMATFGIDYVRGGSYTQVNLPDEDIYFLNREIWHAQGRCTRCGHMGHFVQNCFAKKDIYGNQFDNLSESSDIVWFCDICNEEFDTQQEAIQHEKCCNK